MKLDVVGIRLVKEREIEYNRSITSPMDAVQIMANELRDMDREMVMTVNLNNKNNILNAHVISVGGINSTTVDIKNIFKCALLANANRIMMFHNHPSGDPSPSRDDITFTRVVEDACKIMDIDLLDHIIIGKDSYYSLHERKIDKYELPENNSRTHEDELTEYIKKDASIELAEPEEEMELEI